jgi:phosphorylcholine metabolism protein LicD
MIIILALIIIIVICTCIWGGIIIKKNHYMTTHELIKVINATLGFLKELEIPFQICAGTALGAYRSGKFIPGDDDIDIMIYNFDLKFKTIEEQKNHINNIAKKYDLTPVNKNSAPYLYTRNGKGMPIMYQYKYKYDHILPTVDIYIYYKENEHVWLFCAGGETSKMGFKLPFDKPMTVKLHNQKLPCSALSHLKAFYGPNFMTPIKKSDKNYYKMKKTFYGEFPDKWLIPIK